ncbi:fluoride efflux transporter CrcB [Deinococcus radiomollis]|uniref:fluoride efflux transporter CrcB n=1 Tax=Deinococcus radiomollis TaxID=468916 RepID=UPI003892A796
MWSGTMLTGVALGGMLGALARYALTVLLTPLLTRTGSAWATLPWATLLINVSGSFALGLIAALAARNVVSPEWRTAIGVGFLGAYTTFSTFSVDLDGMLSRGEGWRASTYLLGNVGLGLLAAVGGRLLAERLMTR